MIPYAHGNGWEVHHGDVLRLLMDWPADSIDGLDEDAPCPPGFYTVPNRGERLHIAQKPLEVLTPLLGCVRPGGRVLDPFGGSGSTGVAALRTGRTAVLFDVMESNCDLMAERLEAESRGVDLIAARAGTLSMFGVQ